jgi:hypothetical protein
MSIVASKDSAGNFQSAIAKIERAKVKNALTAMLDVAGNDVQKFRDSVEQWFNSTMGSGVRLV